MGEAVLVRVVLRAWDRCTRGGSSAPLRVLAAYLAELITRGTSARRRLRRRPPDRLIVRARPDLQVSGVDVLVRPDAHIAVTPFDGRRLPFGDRSRDTVLLCDVLHHTASP